MEKAKELLIQAGYDAFILHGRLYFRTAEGGVEAVNSETEVANLITRKQ